MENQEKMKKLRSDTKRANTLAMRKFDGLIHVGSSEESLKKQAEVVEKSYDELLNVCIEYSEIVDDEEEELYMKANTDEYYRLMSVYNNLIKAGQDIEKKKKENALRLKVERGFLKIRSTIDRIQGEDTENKRISELEEDKSLLDLNLQSLIDSLSELSTLDDTSLQNKEVDSMLFVCEKLKRDINISIREQSGKVFEEKKTIMNSSIDPLSPPVSSTLSKEQYFSPPPTSLRPEANTFMPSQVKSSTLSVVTATMTKPSSLVVCTTAPQEDFLRRSASVVHDSNPMSLPSSSSVHVPFNYHSGYHSSAAYNAGVLESETKVVTSVLGSTPLTLPSSSSVAGPFHNNLGYFPESPHPCGMNLSSAHSSPIYTKKPSLPTFSGDRADWPEFRCVWVSMAEPQFSNRVQLAMELKRSCKGKAAERVRHIYVTNEHAYEEIWQRLREEYDDPGLCSQEAINRLMSLKPVGEQDFAGLVNVIDTVDGIYNQLRELNQLNAVHAVDVDRVSVNLPGATHMEWLRRYNDLSAAEKLAPFGAFVTFLRRERAAVARLAENMPKRRQVNRTSSHLGQGVDHKNSYPHRFENQKSSCIVHTDSSHPTEECRSFLRMTISQRYNCLRREKKCFNCFDSHSRGQCTAPVCAVCGKAHHKLLCVAKETENESDDSSRAERTGSHLASAGTMALYPICHANIKGSSIPVTIMLDGGSNASYVTTRCAQKHKLKLIDRVKLSVTTVGGKDREYQSAIYEAHLRTTEGKSVKVSLYELPRITGRVSLLNRQVIEELFPEYDSDILGRATGEVDMLIGTDYFGLHPKEELSKAGDNLSVMRGQLGVCLVGTHPLLKDYDQIQREVPKTLHLSEIRTHTFHASIRSEHVAFSRSENFIAGEELGTECSPKCGACKCGKCPIPGHDLSFREEQELLMIRSNLIHDSSLKAWTTSYPWVKDPKFLPDNYPSAIGTLRNTEKSLNKDPDWAESYQAQIVDMIDREVVRKLSPQEVEDWDQPFSI